MRGFFIFEGTPSFLKKYQKGTPRFLIAVPQPQVILERLFLYIYEVIIQHFYNLIFSLRFHTMHLRLGQ